MLIFMVSKVKLNSGVGIYAQDFKNWNHSKDYTIQDGMIKSTDNTFLLSIEKAKEENVKAMLIDMYYDSTVPGSYLNGEYTEGSVKLTNRRIMGINNPTTTSIFQDLIQILETGFTKQSLVK